MEKPMHATKLNPPPHLAAAVHLRCKVDEATTLLRHGCFAAAARCLPDPDHWLAPLDPARDLAAAGWLRKVATFYGAWQARAYPTAAVAAPASPPPGAAPWLALAPSAAAVAWVRGLAVPEPEERTGRLDFGRRLAAELVARGEGALAQGRLNDATRLRSAAIERRPRNRLLDHNLDMRRLPAGQRAVRDLIALGPNRVRRTDSPRVWQTDLPGGRLLLTLLDDPLGAALDSDRLAIFRRRNHLADTHGSEAIAGDSRPILEEGFAALAGWLVPTGGPTSTTDLDQARTPDRLLRDPAVAAALALRPSLTPRLTVTLATQPHTCVLN